MLHVICFYISTDLDTYAIWCLGNGIDMMQSPLVFLNEVLLYREREEAELTAAVHASRYTASEESASARRKSPTLLQATDGAASVSTTTNSRGSNKKQTSGMERKYKDTLSLSADQKTSNSLVSRVEESCKPQNGVQDSVPLAVGAVSWEVLDCEDVKMTLSTSTARKPPGFENVARRPEVPSSVQELQKVTPISQTPTPSAPNSCTSKKVSRHAVQPPVQDDWPSLNARGAPEEARSKNTLVPPGFQQPSAKASVVSLISKLQASVESRASYDEFRALSGLYASEQMRAREYHTRCQRLLGEHTWNSLGPELARTLPDISKQKELLAMFPTAESAGDGNRSKSKGHPRAPRAQKNGVWASRGDRNLCDENEFPSLQDAVDLPDYPQQTPGWNYGQCTMASVL